MHRQKFKRVQISKSVFLKSGLEEVVYNCLNKNKCVFVYEGLKITFTSPEQKRTYTPDFPVSNSNIIIETKGAFNSADRKKMKLIQKQNPKLDIRFIFSNSKNKIGQVECKDFIYLRDKFVLGLYLPAVYYWPNVTVRW